MSLFQCDVCGCRENTAYSFQGFHLWPQLFDWSYAPERRGKCLCSVCGPEKFKDGRATGCGKWHDTFPRIFLPKGMFITNAVGNLAHRDTGEESYSKYSTETEQ